jgi:PAS domain S-box-containing protein
MEQERTAGRPNHTTSRSGGSRAGGAQGAAAEPDIFRMTVEWAAAGICHLDLSGRFLYVNPALCRLTGYSREELLARSFQDITHPDDVAENQAYFRRLLAGDVPSYRLEKRYYRRDGSLVWLQVHVTLRRNASGAPQHVIAIIEDISERKQLEEQLREANERLAMTVRESQEQSNDLTATFDAMTDLVVVFDAEGRVRRTNQAAREFMGSHPTLDAGRRFLRLAMVSGTPLPREQWPSARILRGETFTGAQALDMYAQAPSGRKVLLNISGAPVHSPRGEIVGGVLVMRDVTARRELENRTREALDALLQMAEALVAPPPELPQEPLVEAPIASLPPLNPVAQRLADLAARVLGCSRVGIVSLKTAGDIMRPLAVTGLPPEQAAIWCAGLDGRSMTEFIGDERMRQLRAGGPVQLDLERPPLRSVARGGPVALAVPLRLGEQLVGALALGYEQEPHPYTEGELMLAGGVGQLAALVIERERLLQEREEARANALALREANRRMEEFLGIASHELRTPLTSLVGNLQMLERRLGREPLAGKGAAELASQLEMARDVLARMDRQGKQLSRLVGDLVDASRIKSGRLEHAPRPCDLAAIVREVVEEQRQAHPERTIALDLPDATPVPVLADPDRLGQVVTNYLTNAQRYSRVKEPIEVCLRVEGETARVSVRDHGPGLPPEELPRVWELFHRVPGVIVQSGSGLGMGLGLHICKTIVERHGGQVGVESTLGEGSTFWFTLPLASGL